MSHSKCSYCEVDITTESNYMEVEHFRGKDDFPDLVVAWDNLLPSCKRCNVQKGTHNVDTDGMIIDPTSVEPKQHLYLKNYRLSARSDLGERTIDVVYLNQSDRLVEARFKVGERTLQALEKLRALYNDYCTSPNDQRKRRIVRGLEELLREAQPDREYSATSATVLTESPDFQFLRDNMTAGGLWESDLEEMYSVAFALSLPVPNHVAA